MAVFKRPGHRFYRIRFSIKFNEKTKKVDISSKSENEQDAKFLEAKLYQEAMNELRFGIKPSKTWKQAREEWMIIKQHKKSLWNDEYYFNWLSPHFDHLNLEEITNSKIEELARSREDKGIGAPTINRMLALIKSVLRMCWKQKEWIDKVPYIRLRKENDGRIKYLKDWNEANKLLFYLSNTMHLYYMVKFTLLTGLRSTNIKTLLWTEIDFKNKLIIIPGTKMKSGRNFSRPFCKEAEEILLKLKGNHPLYVFTYKGNPIKSCNTKAYRNALKKAEIKDFTFHDLRHTYGTWWTMEHGNLRKLMKLMDITSFPVILVYAHCMPEHLREEFL